MPAAEVLPQSVYPYIAMMLAGFVVGALGHGMRSRVVIAIGIALIFLATLLFPLAINLTGENPWPPSGPTPSPY